MFSKLRLIYKKAYPDGSTDLQ